MGRRKKLKVYIDVCFMGIVDKGWVVGRDVEGKVIFVDGVVLGDVVDVFVKCKKKGVFMGMVQEIRFYFFDWVELVCEYFWLCGGCKWQYFSYEVQVWEKEKVVCDIFSWIGKVEVEEFLFICVVEQIIFYCNKFEFFFFNKCWLIWEEIEFGIINKVDVLGFYCFGVFDKVIDIDKCWLQFDFFNDLCNGIKEIVLEQGLIFYDVWEYIGFMWQVMFCIII